MWSGGQTDVGVRQNDGAGEVLRKATTEEEEEKETARGHIMRGIIRAVEGMFYMAGVWFGAHAVPTDTDAPKGPAVKTHAFAHMDGNDRLQAASPDAVKLAALIVRPDATGGGYWGIRRRFLRSPPPVRGVVVPWPALRCGPALPAEHPATLPPMHAALRVAVICP